MTACDDSSDGGSSDCAPGTWKVVTPKNGATNVDCGTNIVLKYCGTLDTTIDTEQLFIHDPNNGAFDMAFTDANSTITIEGGTVIIDADATNSIRSSETTYTELEISGFTDSDLILIDTFIPTDYSFTSCDK
jgi:hypothetical protein